MAIKGAKSIAEYVIRRELINQGLDVDCMKVTMNGNEATIEDTCGNTMKLVYDNVTKEVFPIE